MPEPAREPAAETVEFIYQHTRSALDGEIAQARALDGKIAQVFAAATVVIGLAGATGVTKTPAQLLLAALAAYVVALVATIVALWPVKLRGSDHGGTLWNEHWDRTPAQIRYSIAEAMPEASKHNVCVIDRKAYSLMAVLGATGLEAALVGVALIASRLG
jgi:hypothetical protein